VQKDWEVMVTERGASRRGGELRKKRKSILPDPREKISDIQHDRPGGCNRNGWEESGAQKGNAETAQDHEQKGANRY